MPKDIKAELKNQNIFDPEIAIPKIQGKVNFVREFFRKLFSSKKKTVIIIVLLIGAFLFLNGRGAKNAGSGARSTSVKIDRSFDMNAITNQGKTAPTKIKFKIATVEKTDQVLVKDQMFTAKNNKMFLILNLDLKNDSTAQLNILPGDLLRLAYSSDEENKYAPDLHNNLVLVSAISTKNDRVGFVIPKEINNFKLYVGEIEGKKEEIDINFPS